MGQFYSSSLSVFFYILTNALLYIQVIFYIIHNRMAKKTRKSPNNARHVLFVAIHACLFFSYMFFILPNVLLYIQVIIYVIHDIEGVGQ